MANAQRLGARKKAGFAALSEKADRFRSKHAQRLI
jgi:hypothetical protein